MTTRRPLALARFALAGNLRTPYTWAGAALFFGLTALGLVSSARAGRGLIVDPGFVFDGAVLAALFGLRSGLVAQRRSGLRAYLRSYVSPVEHTAGAILSLLGVWLLVSGAVFTFNLALPGGSPTEAGWQVTVFAVRTGPLLPFVLLTERFTTIEIPFVLPALAYVGLLMALVVVFGEVEALAALAPPLAAHDYRSVLPVAGRTGAVMALGFGALLGAAGLRGPKDGLRPARRD